MRASSDDSTFCLLNDFDQSTISSAFHEKGLVLLGPNSGILPPALWDLIEAILGKTELFEDIALSSGTSLTEFFVWNSAGDAFSLDGITCGKGISEHLSTINEALFPNASVSPLTLTARQMLTGHSLAKHDHLRPMPRITAVLYPKQYDVFLQERNEKTSGQLYAIPLGEEDEIAVPIIGRTVAIFHPQVLHGITEHSGGPPRLSMVYVELIAGSIQ